MDLLTAQTALSTWFSALVAATYRKHNQVYPADRLDYETLAKFPTLRGQPLVLLFSVELFDRLLTAKQRSVELQAFTNEALLATAIETSFQNLCDYASIDADVLLLDDTSLGFTKGCAVALFKTPNLSLMPDFTKTLTLLETLLPQLHDGYAQILLAQLFELTLVTTSTDHLDEANNVIRCITLMLGRNPFLFDDLHLSLFETRLRPIMLDNRDMLTYIIEIMTMGLCFEKENAARVEDLLPIINATIAPLLEARASDFPFQLGTVTPIDALNAMIEFNTLLNYPAFGGLDADLLTQYFQTPARAGSLTALFSSLSRESVFISAELIDEDVKFGIIEVIDEFLESQGQQSVEEAVSRCVECLKDCFETQLLYSVDFDRNPFLRAFPAYRELIISSLKQQFSALVEVGQVVLDHDEEALFSELLNGLTDSALLQLLVLNEKLLQYDVMIGSTLMLFAASNITIVTLFKSLLNLFGEHSLLNLLELNDFSCLMIATKCLTPDAMTQIIEQPNERAKFIYRMAKELVYSLVKSGRCDIDNEKLMALAQDVGMDLGNIQKELTLPAHLRECISSSMFTLFSGVIESPSLSFADDCFSPNYFP